MKCTLCGNTKHALCAGKQPNELVQISVEKARQILYEEYHLLQDFIEKRFPNLEADLLYCSSCKHIFRPPSGGPTVIAFPGELGEWAGREDPVGILNDAGLTDWYEWWDSLS